MENRTCRTCKEEQTIDDFSVYRWHGSKPRRRHVCRTCRALASSIEYKLRKSSGYIPRAYHSGRRNNMSVERQKAFVSNFNQILGVSAC